MFSRLQSFALAAALSLCARTGTAQEPTGLAASALANPSFTWIHRVTAGFRVYFLVDSYSAAHQDSLLARLPLAARHAETLLHVPPLTEPIDLFFVESREQMTQLIGGRATGFAQPSARTVLLVTNPGWRAFEGHEITHVLAGQRWGQAGPQNDWLVEGLAQAADGRCGRWSNAGVLAGLVSRRGWIPFATVLADFRSQPDLRAYLQAATFVDYLLRRFGPRPLQRLWSTGSTVDSELAGHSLGALEAEWRHAFHERSVPNSDELTEVEAKGCG